MRETRAIAPQGGVRRNRQSPSALVFLVNLLVLMALLILPAVALHRHAFSLPWTGLYVAAISVFAYWRNARDKRLAQTGEWRVSEAQLHLLELIGGWPGAWIAQRLLRHKTSKAGYQTILWLIIIAHQLAAYDSLQGWKWARAGLKWAGNGTVETRQSHPAFRSDDIVH